MRRRCSSVVILRVNAESKVDDAAPHVAADEVADCDQHRFSKFVEVGVFDAIRVQQLLGAVPQLQVVTRHTGLPHDLRHQLG